MTPLEHETLSSNKCLRPSNPTLQIYIYIYIYTRFQKGFHIERYIDRYILLFSCTCARVHFSFFTCYCPTCEKLGSTINFFFVGFFVPISKEHVFYACALRYKFCNGELNSWCWEWKKTSREDTTILQKQNRKKESSSFRVSFGVLIARSLSE